MKKKIIATTLIIAVLCTLFVGCSAKEFTLERIEYTVDSPNSISASDIALVGYFGSKEVEINLSSAFENYKIKKFSGNFDRPFIILHANIVSLNLELSDENGISRSLSISKGDTFSAVKSEDGVKLILP